MQKKYHKTDIIVPENRFEGMKTRDISLDSTFYDFQCMSYNLQLGEKHLEYPDATVELLVTDPVKYASFTPDFEHFLTVLLDEQISVSFDQISRNSHVIQRLTEHSFDYISLFSGGLDSISIPFQLEYKNHLGILHHTITSPNSYGKAKRIFSQFFKNRNLCFITSSATNRVDDPSYLKTRGVVFLTNLMCVAAALSVKRVVVPENGPFMINLPVSYNADPTSTANPEMLDLWRGIFYKITGYAVTLETPFLNKTKSEVILSTGTRQLIPETWSCSYFQGLSKMCGMCNSCLVRILSCYAIDEGESISGFYQTNPFTVNLSSLGSINRNSYRISLEAFKYWISIVNPEHLPEIEQNKFLAIRKHYSIMLKHSLDMLLGFKKLSDQYKSKQPLFSQARKLLTFISNDILNARDDELQHLKKRVDWN